MSKFNVGDKVRYSFNHPTRPDWTGSTGTVIKTYDGFKIGVSFDKGTTLREWFDLNTWHDGWISTERFDLVEAAAPVLKEEPIKTCSLGFSWCDCALEEKEAKEAKEEVVEETPKEAVNHPAHYGGDTTYEVIKVAEAWGMDKDAYLFNVLKYIARAGKKGSAQEDLKKAEFYITRRIDNPLEEAK